MTVPQRPARRRSVRREVHRRLTVALLLAFTVSACLSGAPAPVAGEANAGEPAPAEAASATPERLSGATRYDTAVVVSSVHWEASEVAVLATGADFPDALAGVALAASRGAPLLLTRPDALPGDVGSELERLGVREVLALGGPAAIDDAVLDEVRGLSTAPQVRRVAGDDRYATAAAVAALAGAPGGEVAVASAADFPDAVAAGALAATAERPPVLLVDHGAVPAETADALSALDAGQALVLGGTAVISEAVRDELEDAVGEARRLAGADRYATSTAVTDEALDRLDDTPRPLLVVSGADFPDALAAGALAAQLEGVVLLVPPDGLTDELDTWLGARRDRIADAVVVGGTAAVAERTAEQVAAALDASVPREPGEYDVVGVLGCSNTRDAVEGYHMVSDRGVFWERVPYSGLTVAAWADPDHGSFEFAWDRFDENYDALGADVFWWQLCIRPGTADLDTAKRVLVHLRERSDAPVYASPLDDTPSCDGGDPAGSQWLVDELVAEGLVLHGPIMPPLDADEIRDACHPNDPGKEKWGAVLVEWFD